VDQVPDCDVASHRELVAGSYPDYFLCEVDELASVLGAGRVVSRQSRSSSRLVGPSGRGQAPSKHRDPVINTSSRSANRSFLRGIDAGGRRVSMPGLRHVVSSAAQVFGPGQSCVSATEAVGAEYARSNNLGLPPMRAGVDDPFAQVGGAVRGSARPTLSASSATQQASACSPE